MNESRIEIVKRHWVSRKALYKTDTFLLLLFYFVLYTYSKLIDERSDIKAQSRLPSLNSTF